MNDGAGVMAYWLIGLQAGRQPVIQSVAGEMDGWLFGWMDGWLAGWLDDWLADEKNGFRPSRAIIHTLYVDVQKILDVLD